MSGIQKEKLENLVEDFHSWLIKNEDFSEGGAYDYKKVISRMIKATKAVYPSDIDKKVLLSYFEEKLSNSGKRKNRPLYFKFFKYLIARKAYKDENPAEELPKLGFIETLEPKRILSDDERIKILKSLKFDSPIECRASVCVLLFLYTGLERMQIVKLKWKEVKLSENFIVFDKKGYEEKIPVMPRVMKAIRKYMEVLQKEFGELPGDYVFYRALHNGKPRNTDYMNYNSFHYFWGKISDWTGIPIFSATVLEETYRRNLSKINDYYSLQKLYQIEHPEKYLTLPDDQDIFKKYRETFSKIDAELPE